MRIEVVGDLISETQRGWSTLLHIKPQRKRDHLSELSTVQAVLRPVARSAWVRRYIPHDAHAGNVGSPQSAGYWERRR